MYVGGVYEEVNSIAARNVSYWDGNQFHAMRDGLDNRVLALQAHGGDIYAGGDFVSDGGFIYYNHIARWDGDVWSPVGGGMGGGSWPVVNALEVYDGKLIAGGQFLEAGGVPAPHIASWDGTQWAGLGTGTDNWIFALTSFGGGVAAGGMFTAAGEHEAGRVACWDGTSWNGLGTGVQDWVRTLCERDGSLYVGGNFQMAGEGASYYIARWEPDGNAAAPELADLTRSHLRLASSNPVSNRLELVFTLRGPSAVSLDLVDVQGRQIANLYEGSAPAGEHAIRVDRSDLRAAGPGVYFARLRSGIEQQSVKLLWVE